MNYLTTLKEHLRLFWRLRNDIKISDAKFVRCINVSNPSMNYLTTLKEHLRLFWRLRNDIKISDAKFVRCYLELFLGGAATKIPEKIKSVGFVFGAR
jgi:hypothetical protein